jgi:hypothetical protein
MGRSLAEQHGRELTPEQDLELLCGPYIGPNWPDDRDDDKAFIRERSNFASEEERRQAWRAHRERLIEQTPDWTRPWAAEHYG